MDVKAQRPASIRLPRTIGRRDWLDVCDRLIGDALIGAMLLLSIALCIGAA